MLRLGCLILAICLGLTSAALAQQQSRLHLSGASGGDLEAGTLYMVSYNCTPVPKAKGKSAHTLADLFGDLQALAPFLPFGQTSETFGFYLTKGAPTAAGSTTFADVGTMIGAEHVYTVGQNQSSSFGNTSCGRVYVVNGKDRPTLMGFVSSSKTADTKALAGIATLLSSSVGPLFSLFAGSALPAIDQSKLTSGVSVLNNYSTFLAVFDNTQTESQVVALKTGHMVLSTDLVAINIDVEPVPDMLVAKGLPFRSEIDAYLTAAGTLATADLSNPTGLADKCRLMATQLLGVGITSPLDQAYILSQLVLKASPTKPSSFVLCLGRERALAALPHMSLFRLGDLSFTLSDINDFGGDPNFNADLNAEQPQGWPGLHNVATTLVNDANRIGRGITLADEDQQDLAGLFDTEVKVDDRTGSYFVRGALAPTLTSRTIRNGPALDTMQWLVAGGLKNWGCFVETDANLATKSPSNEALALTAWLTTATDFLPVTVRVLFRDRKIAWLIFDDANTQAVVTASTCTPPPKPAKIVPASTVTN